jgi:hypothetical protein
MQFYFYRIDRESNGHKMVKGTCLIAHRRIDQSPHMFELEILVYLILKSSFVDSRTNSPYAQAYNHINAAIISIGIFYGPGRARSMVDRSPWPTTRAHRSLAMGRSGRRGIAPTTWEGGGEARDAHWR